MRYVWAAAACGVLFQAPLLYAIADEKADISFEAGLAAFGVLLIVPVIVWALWRAGWAIYRQIVIETRRAHKP